MKHVYLINGAFVSPTSDNEEIKLSTEDMKYSYLSVGLFKNDKEDFILHLSDGNELTFPKDSILVKKYVNDECYLVVSEDTPFTHVIDWIDRCNQEGEKYRTVFM